MEIRTRLAGAIITLFGAFSSLFGGLVLAGAIQAWFTGENAGPSDAKGGFVFLTIGAAAVRYGWRCLRGFERR